ncbi:MAG: phosphoadenylyl-sulfate reductase [Anaerolineae bacterium]|nr:phosphoadenylyl-sulfate reductase [Anaerolineae bacterium]
MIELTNTSTIAASQTPPALTWFPANLPSLNRRFARLEPEDVLNWGLTTFGEQTAVATGFGPTGIILLHMISQIRPKTQVFYLQTDLFFPETLALRDELAERLNINFIEVRSELSLDQQSRQYGPELWKHNPDLCCQLRKIDPMRKFLADKKAWVTGLRRDQSSARANIELVSWDSANHLLKLCPLAFWSRKQVWDYIYSHNLPYNELHDRGYPSIGCQPCTKPAKLNSGDERAGRWTGLDKTECGIHFHDGQIVRLAEVR